MGKEKKEAPQERRPPLVRGWSAKVVLPSQHFDEFETKVLLCNTSKSGLAQIARELTENEDLQELDLRHHYFVPPDGATLGRGLAQNLGLRVLNLQNNELSDGGTSHIAAALQQQNPNTLEDLNLNANGIGDSGCREISNFIRSSEVIKVLKLQHNHIGAVGARFIGDALAENRTLKTLHIGSNDLRDGGAVAIAEGLIAGSTVKDLDLGINSIANEGSRLLGEALRSNCPLQRLMLRVNRIREQGLRRIFEGLLDNDSIKELDLGGNVVEDNVTDWITAFLSRTRKLTKFNLEDNFLTDHFGREVIKACERNAELPLVSLILNNNRLTELQKEQVDLLVRTNANEIAKREKEMRELSGKSRKTRKGRRDV